MIIKQYVRKYVHMYVCVGTHAYTCTHTHTNAYLHTYPHIRNCLFYCLCGRLYGNIWLL